MGMGLRILRIGRTRWCRAVIRDNRGGSQVCNAIRLALFMRWQNRCYIVHVWVTHVNWHLMWSVSRLQDFRCVRICEGNGKSHLNLLKHNGRVTNIMLQPSFLRY